MRTGEKSRSGEGEHQGSGSSKGPAFNQNYSSLLVERFGPSITTVQTAGRKSKGVQSESLALAGGTVERPSSASLSTRRPSSVHVERIGWPATHGSVARRKRREEGGTWRVGCSESPT